MYLVKISREVVIKGVGTEFISQYKHNVHILRPLKGLKAIKNQVRHQKSGHKWDLK